MREREMNWNDDILEKHNHIYTQTSLNQKYLEIVMFISLWITFYLHFKFYSPKNLKKKINKKIRKSSWNLTTWKKPNKITR